MKLKLEKPIVFLDIESTGLDLEMDRIIELALCKIHPDGTREVKTNRYNPAIHIPEASTEIHGITDEDVKDKPFFKQHAKGIVSFMEGCDIGGFNSNFFDIPMLYTELARAGVEFDYKSRNLIDVGNIFKIKEQRNLAAAYKFYCNQDIENAHSAEADILATVDVFFAQVERYEDMPEDMTALALFSNYDKPILDLFGKFTTDKDGNILLNFGKHKGQKAADNLSFLEWMLYRGTFHKDTLKVATDILTANGH